MLISAMIRITVRRLAVPRVCLGTMSFLMCFLERVTTKYNGDNDFDKKKQPAALKSRRMLSDDSIVLD